MKFECVRYDVKESVMCDVCLCDNCAACSSYSCANTYYIEEEIKFNVLLMRRAAHHRAVVRAPRHRFEHVVGSFVLLLYLLCTCIRKASYTLPPPNTLRYIFQSDENVMQWLFGAVTLLSSYIYYMYIIAIYVCTAYRVKCLTVG